MLLVASLALAADPAGAQPPAPPPLKVDVSGQYSLWNLQQNNFLLGAEHPLDDAAYTVQNLRVKVGLGRERYGAVARFDAAQGWWGVDNSPANGYALTTDAEGNSLTTRVYNDDSLFRDKETAYGIHFDLAYGWAAFGPVEVRGGRQFFGVGNKLVLDEDYTGVTVLFSPKGPFGADAWWAKVSEGQYAYTLPSGALMSDVDANSDADLFGAKLKYAPGGAPGSAPVNAELFCLYYADTIADDWSWLPQGVGYGRSRFTPQITTLGAVGLAGHGKFDKGFSWKAEADVLFGEDAVDNADHAAGALDRNDGSLFGWNVLADATQKLPLKIGAGGGADVGALFGMGSGDDDPGSGAGNVNKLSTMGFWSMTNVWEDSVMPDVEGISPQGLGSPISRGYRELENTTAIQGRVGVVPVKPLRIEGSFTWLMATQPVHGFDATGAPGGATARDLGWEIDANAIVTLRDGGVTGKVLFGWFQPGEAAGLLINGNADSLDPAWEVKTEAAVNF